MRRQPLTTIKTEGGLFPPDFLQRVTGSSSTIPSLTTEAYHLAGKEKLNEAASRAWNRLLGIWTVFYATNIPAGDPRTTTTREKWLLPLFGELGYGRLLLLAYSASFPQTMARCHSVCETYSPVFLSL
jgi:hypothetical protein